MASRTRAGATPGPRSPGRRGRLRRSWAAAALAAAFVFTGAGIAPARAEDDEPGYGDAGATEVALQLGFGSDYFGAGAGLRYFVVQGIAPGIEGSYQKSNGVGEGLLLGSLRLAPVRLGTVVPVLTGRAGRVFLSDHDSGWAVGGDIGILILASPHIAFEIGYGFLHFVPDSFCADLVSCTIYQPEVGIRVTF